VSIKISYKDFKINFNPLTSIMLYDIKKKIDEEGFKNPLPDTTFEGFVIPSIFDERDYIFENYNKNNSIPLRYSVREDMLEVRDQENTNTCVAQTVSAIKEYQEYIEDNYKRYFSPSFIYEHRLFKLFDKGMMCKTALHFLYKKGIVEEKLFPFKSNKKITEEMYEKAKENRIKSYARIITVKGAKQFIHKYGPIMIVLPIKSYSSKFWKGNLNKGFHAVTVVGWTFTGFIIRNSWGKKWGFDGHSIISYKDYEKKVHEAWGMIDNKQEGEKK
ncbi:MAG: C1 family peptidase, partial [bacterium]